MNSLIIFSAFLCVVFLALLCLVILNLRDQHSAHVYMIWYTYSLTLCVTSLVIFTDPQIIPGLVDTDKIHLSSLEEGTRNLMKDLLDPPKELYLISAVLLVFVVPQLISFVLSGIFGCASTPKFISRVSTACVFSLVKFSCIVSAILSAEVLFMILGPSSSGFRIYSIGVAAAATAWIFFSFAILAAYYFTRRLHSQLSTHDRIKWLGSVLQYTSRYRDESRLSKLADTTPSAPAK
jgi:hypothetical protein